MAVREDRAREAVSRRAALWAGGGALAGAASASALDRHVVGPATPGGLIDISSFGAVGDGRTDDTPALTAAITAALTARPSAVMTGQSTYRTAIVYLPPGVYRTTRPIEVDLAVPSTAVTDRRTLFLKGAGTGSAIILCDRFTGPALHVWHGAAVLEDLSFFGGDTFTGIMLELGKQSGDDYANQCALNRVAFRGSGEGGTMLRASWLFDSSFTDVQFMGLGQRSVGMDIPPNPIDNCNNLSFRRCHWEACPEGTLLRIHSEFGARTTHSSLTFEGCHWETRSYRSQAIDLEGVSRVAFIGAHVPHNNEPVGRTVGATADDAVPPIRLVNVVGASWTTCTVTREGPPANFPTHLMSLGGVVRGLVFQSCYFITNDDREVVDASSLWQEDAVSLNAATDAGPIQVIGCVANSYSNPELAGG